MERLTFEGNFCDIAQYPSMADAARSARTSSGHICECVRGKRKTAGGYHWALAEEALRRADNG